MALRAVIAGLLHETNTFSPVATPLDAFFPGAEDPARPLNTGQQVIDSFGDANVAFAGFLDLARQAGADIAVPIYAHANPSAPTDARAFDTMAGQIVGAVRQGCDAIMLDLHGAMVAEGHDDGEAELLRRIREVAPDTPIAVALDFHANISPALAAGADVITGYRTYPHIDMRETGERAGRTLLAALRGEVRPVMVHAWLPMLTHMNRHSPQFQPMQDLMNKAIRAEADGSVLNASIFGGFPLADVPWAGFSVVVVADAVAAGGEAAARARAQALCDEICDEAWARRQEFVFEIEPLTETVARARQIRHSADAGTGKPRRPVVLADHSNNTASGGSVDTMASVAEIMAQDLQNVIAGPVCDPSAVARLIEAGVGARVSLDVGGRIAAPAIGMAGAPLALSGTVRSITDGRFRVTGPMFTGVMIHCGRTVVLDTGTVKLLLSEQRVEPFDLGVFTHAGLDPLQADYILLWSRQHFRAGFEPIAEQVLMLAGPGVCSSDYSQFPFARIQRPIYPLDTQMTRPAGHA